MCWITRRLISEQGHTALSRKKRREEKRREEKRREEKRSEILNNVLLLCVVYAKRIPTH
jgi:hypothetical protein